MLRDNALCFPSIDRGLEGIIDPFYGTDVPRQHGGTWKRSFQDLEQQRSVSRCRLLRSVVDAGCCCISTRSKLVDSDVPFGKAIRVKQNAGRL